MEATKQWLSTEDIRIRDPFILTAVTDEHSFYYMYGTTDDNPWAGPGAGFDAYRSRDLRHWEGPFPVFRVATGSGSNASFWGKENFWAPEVHRLDGQYYMLASFKAPGYCRGTQLLAANHPLGPFQPLTNEPLTPPDWECLDGTLYQDDEGQRWIVFCREWLEVVDGEMYARRLKPDMTGTLGEPYRLFSASEAPWTILQGNDTHQGYVTDGPFLFSPRSGELWMIWSSYGEEGYAMGLARSQSGGILGPWKQENEPFFRKDGGHGMLFRTWEGQLALTLHCPNDTPRERAQFHSISIEQDRFIIERRHL
ncbi:glycoside hydrolase family 43 protein [Paenibacillus sp. J5C_2022]|uniref:glycoside hydrolase family 43 protein n=1 Tax=Paenibacillus sp. J5C2022 TaxID=2977129 RepID=UPI0021CEC554|nr:glycoside hydrolase family 43 protein [Paenibacillus sp. J5C2022]MCU6707856.1 glycoside hydrolase family 43 protein [Paenibacillus sp. J5C2022]